MRGKNRNGALNVPRTPIGEHIRKIASVYPGERGDGLRQAADILEAEVKRAGVDASLLFPMAIARAPVAGDAFTGRLERALERLEELVADLVAGVRDAPRAPRELPAILRDSSADEDLDEERASPQREKGERVVLTSIAQARGEATRRWVAVLTGYKSRTITTYTSRLRSKGYLSADDLVATEQGLAWLGAFAPLDTGRELRESWRAKLPLGERELLDEFMRAHPGSITHAELVDRTRFASRTVTTYLSRLRSRQLIVRARRGYSAAPELFT